jgi:hypothetical protein
MLVVCRQDSFCPFRVRMVTMGSSEKINKIIFLFKSFSVYAESSSDYRLMIIKVFIISIYRFHQCIVFMRNYMQGSQAFYYWTPIVTCSLLLMNCSCYRISQAIRRTFSWKILYLIPLCLLVLWRCITEFAFFNLVAACGPGNNGNCNYWTCISHMPY